MNNKKESPDHNSATAYCQLISSGQEQSLKLTQNLVRCYRQSMLFIYDLMDEIEKGDECTICGNERSLFDDEPEDTNWHDEFYICYEVYELTNKTEEKEQYSSSLAETIAEAKRGKKLDSMDAKCNEIRAKRKKTSFK